MKQLAKLCILLNVIVGLGTKPSGMTAAAGQTVGNCLYECETSLCADFGNHSDFCGEIRAKCQVKCSNLKYWGAIAYSAKDKGAGWSFGWNDLEKAKKEAMNRCAKQGQECKLWAWFDNSCGALAADGNIASWGTAYAKADADRRALLECKKAGGRNCSVQASVCSRK